MSPEAISNAQQVLESGFVGQGPSVDEFEKLLHERLDSNVLTLNSGTSALSLALTLCNLKDDDEVITTPMTCTATNLPIVTGRGKLVWADVEPDTGNISVLDIKKKLTSKTKAIMCVAWGGYPPALDELYSLAKSNNCYLIHDAAHAFNAKFNGISICNYADFTCFSFQAIKHLTTVDGGALCCRSNEMHNRAKLLRWYGFDRCGSADFRCAQNIKEAGFKYHMNDLNASIGIGNLLHIDDIINKHVHNATQIISNICGCSRVGVIKTDVNRPSQYWILTLLLDNVDKFIKFMASKGIVTSRVHSRNDTHDCFKQYDKGALYGLKDFYEHQVSIPCGWWLSSNDIEQIITAIKEYDNGSIYDKSK